MPTNCAEQAPILEADDVETAVRDRLGPRRVLGAAVVAASAAFIVVGAYFAAKTSQEARLLWTRSLLQGMFGMTPPQQFSELHSTDCGWIPGDLCLQADPEKCRCRALWRSGKYGWRGYGPCGREGERDPCIPVPNRDAINTSEGFRDDMPSSLAEQDASTNRLGSFLVIGDWGWDPGRHANVKTASCQIKIAEAMLQKMRELKDVKFIINVGDSFYPSGVKSKSDWQWQVKWRGRFPEELRSVPWYSVYGNHDYHEDPGACSYNTPDGAQINYDISNLNYFYMPGYNWFKEHPELDLEVIALDLNQIMDAWHTKSPFVPYDCTWTPCKETCETLLHSRTTEAVDLFHERANSSTARNLVVFSHYPTDYLWGEFGRWRLIDELRLNVTADGGPRHVTYFGGHRHNVDQFSTKPIWPNNNWLVGGGGGWSCDGGSQGFVVGEISKTFELVTYSQVIGWDECCGDG